jgi:hypothetical protein
MIDIGMSNLNDERKAGNAGDCHILGAVCRSILGGGMQSGVKYILGGAQTCIKK